jgi:hypothetical protein
LTNRSRVTIQGATGCRANKQAALNERCKEAATQGMGSPREDPVWS